MIAQIALSLGLLAVAFYGFIQRRRSRFIMKAMFLVCGIGEVLVLNPSLSTEAANIVGIGRGADLIMYCFIVASLGLILAVHIRLRAQQAEITQLARMIALSTAVSPQSRFEDKAV